MSDNLPGDCTPDDIDEHMKVCEAVWLDGSKVWVCSDCQLMCNKEEFECNANQ